MAKCVINKDNEIIAFYDNSHTQIPDDALECDVIKEVGGIGPPDNIVRFYKLIDGVVTATEAGVDWEAQEYARKREAEYPSIAELTVALYDTDDKADIEAKRAAVKAKYPKP